MRVAKYFVLWFVFITLFTCTIVGLESIEGYKIGTTEYYGLRNLGLVLAIIPIFISSLLYPVIILPLSWLLGILRWIRASRIPYALLYAALWAVSGLWLFHELYEPRFVQEYELQVSTAVILFGLVGLIYGWIEWRLLYRSADVEAMVNPRS